jgi:hypothetical protein
MQYYLASKLGESSSNGTRVFAIAKAEELKFDSRPSNEQLPTLRKDIKAYADVRSQAAAESEGSKPRNDDQVTIESFSVNVPTEKG